MALPEVCFKQTMNPNHVDEILKFFKDVPVTELTVWRNPNTDRDPIAEFVVVHGDRLAAATKHAAETLVQQGAKDRRETHYRG